MQIPTTRHLPCKIVQSSPVSKFGSTHSAFATLKSAREVSVNLPGLLLELEINPFNTSIATIAVAPIIFTIFSSVLFF